MRRLSVLFALPLLVGQKAICADTVPASSPSTTFGVNLYWDSVVQRAGRTEKVCVRLENAGEQDIATSVRIVVPRGLRLKSPAKRLVTKWGRDDVYSRNTRRLELAKNATATWEVEAPRAFEGKLEVIVSADGMTISRKTLKARFTEPVKVAKSEYVPRPVPAETDYLIGAQYFPGWKPDAHYGWSAINPYPDRKPALGWYDESNPEVTDWEIKWALEHGISFFTYCWYRLPGTEGKPVTQMLGHAIHDGLFKSRYGSMFKFAIMWENYSGACISSVDDLMNNLLPYWIETYFKRPEYLKVDNKPLLIVYELVKLKNALGGPDEVKRAIRLMNAACVKAGFDGLVIVAENRSVGDADTWLIRLMTACGFDASFAYCWSGMPQDATDEQATNLQMRYMRNRIDWGYLPNIPTASVGWDPTPWVSYCGYGFAPGTTWQLSPEGYEGLCRQLKQMMDGLPENSLGRKIALLDNWNEFGEGHFIAPTRRAGFRYLDAVRDVFSNSRKKHIDLTPEDAGLGPYDGPYLKWLKDQQDKAEGER